MKYSFLSETSQWRIIKKTVSNIRKSDKPKLKSIAQGSKLLKKQAKKDLILAKDFIKDRPVKASLLTAAAAATAPIPVPGIALVGTIPYAKALRSYAKETKRLL